jgi:membrane protease subunit (stomatin/prohibitin family)
MAFAGMNMANNAGGMNAASLFTMGQQQQQQQQGAVSSWTCSCGTKNTGRFCDECGKEKPAEDGWKCSCGAVNKGKFCKECGAKKPAGVPVYKCDKCGWEPADKSNPPKFCPECGDRFDDDDLVK